MLENLWGEKSILIAQKGKKLRRLKKRPKREEQNISGWGIEAAEDDDIRCSSSRTSGSGSRGEGKVTDTVYPFLLGSLEGRQAKRK